MKFLTIAALIVAGTATSAIALDHDRDDDDGHHNRFVLRAPMDFVFSGPMRMNGRWNGGSAAHSWEELDADDDGRVSRDEYMSAKTLRFEELDADEDGYIDEDELEEFIETRMEVAMEGFNERMREFHVEMEDFHLDMDDLEVEIEDAMDEVDVVVDRIAPRILRMVERFGPGDHGMDRLDENDDGEITREEFMARREKAFEDLDENGDGIISEEELEGADFEFRGERFGGQKRFRFRSN